jgi:sulfur-oxidizing protein SoxY
MAANPALTAPRRAWLGSAAGALLLRILPVAAQTPPAPELAEAIRRLTGGAALANAGLRIEIAELVENGNAVPLRVLLMDAAADARDPVLALWLLSERNPAREVLTLRWPEGWPVAAGVAPPVATRIRLATSQALVALAQTRSGRWWQARADVIVTLAACVEG